MMKTVLAGSLLLLALMTAIPAANAIPPLGSPDCNAVAKDYDNDGIPDFVAAGCNQPVRGCAWVNLGGGTRYCTGRPS